MSKMKSGWLDLDGEV